MCNIVVINKGEKEIATPREFLEHFGIVPDDVEPILMDECLCYCDCEKTLLKNKIPFKTSWGGIYVGMLEDVVGDDD